jgi:hypothetical protein
LFLVVAAQYVDDFLQFEVEALVDEDFNITVEVLRLLGWEIKLQGGVLPKFDQTFTLLGVRMHLEGHHIGSVQVSNQPERVARICQDVERIIGVGNAISSEIESLRGALNFAKSQCFGRCGAASLHFLAAAVRGGVTLLGEVAVEHLRFWPRFFAGDARRLLGCGLWGFVS